MTSTIAFHGAAGTVTGSCYELDLGGRKLLIDCGLFQGSRSLEALNAEPFAFNPRRIEAVILTHAHLDHSGLLPRLVAAGFHGAIHCTPETAELLEHLLRDSARISEQDAERRNRRRDRADEPPVEPLYTTEDAERALALLQPVALRTPFVPVEGVTVELWNAGHILGSASALVTHRGMKLLFSGDLGPDGATLVADPEAPAGIDHVIMESTYGDRARPPLDPEQRRDRLAAEVMAARARGGNLLIPSFALERTQELLLDLAVLINRGRLPNAQIFIDSPLATRITRVFARHAARLDDVDDAHVFAHPAFHYVETVEQSRALERLSGAIIIAGSGMCEGGRIRYHLIDNLARSDSTLLFIGYQATGTLGRTILDGAQRVRISGHDVAVRLTVRQLDDYSAHADRDGLIAWARARRPVAGTLFLTHGEADALAALAGALGADFADVATPALGETWVLTPAGPAVRRGAARADVREILGRGWQNDYAELAVNLRRDLGRIEDPARRRAAIAELRAVLDAYRRP
jgi:metallo-beta-lactamase family protein